jgi:hypothetical protein
MPQFKTTYNILTKPWEDEAWNNNWMDSDKLVLPPKGEWDYNRTMQIEDVNLWEVIYQQGGGLGLYASWDPYAEFYLITHHHFAVKTNAIETYYGPGAQEEVKKRAKELGIPVYLNEIWIDKEDMWLYSKPESKSNILILP